MTASSAAATPEYGRYYYEHYEGTSYGRNPAWIARMGDIADHVMATLKPSTVLDAGCAMGILVEALRNRGAEASGIDISEYAISQIPEPTASFCRQGSLADPLEGTYDLVISIEVLEHIEEVDLQRSLDNLCTATDRILFSSTPEHYEDPTHVNIKQPEQWSLEFARRGFFRDLNYDASFIEPWSALYVRRDLQLEDLVEGYDRSHWYSVREVHRTRQGLIELQRTLSTIEQALPDDGSDLMPADRVADAFERAEAARASAEQDRLMLRDEIMGARREVGEARGRVAELEAELGAALQIRAAYEDLAERHRDLEAQHRAVLGSTSWRLIQKLLAPYRRARGIPG